MTNKQQIEAFILRSAFGEIFCDIPDNCEAIYSQLEAGEVSEDWDLIEDYAGQDADVILSGIDDHISSLTYFADEILKIGGLNE